MRKGYRVGEVAKLFNVSRKTLLHYDKIELFKPDYIDDENGYRYYSSSQLMNLYFIMLLKDAGFSLSDIKEYTQSQSSEKSIKFLKEKEKIIDLKIKELKRTQKIIREKQKEFQRIAEIKDSEPEVVTEGPFYGIVREIERPGDDVEITHAYYYFLEIEPELEFENRKYITSLSKENILKKSFFRVEKVGILIPECEHERYEGSELVFEKGVYVTAIHKEAYENLGKTYEKLLNFIEKNSYEVIGASLELNNEWMLQLDKGIGNIMRIMIPVRKKV